MTRLPPSLSDDFRRWHHINFPEWYEPPTVSYVGTLTVVDLTSLLSSRDAHFEALMKRLKEMEERTL